MLRPCLCLLASLVPALSQPPPEAASAPRVVVVGDVHGDLQALRDALRLAGVVDAAGRWVGGGGVVVQTGDIVDRGPLSDVCIEYLAGLKEEAHAAGGEVVNLLGNHEALSLLGNLDYVSQQEYRRMGGYTARIAAFAPSGKFGRWIVQHCRCAYRHGSTFFVHAGLTLADARRGSAELNREMAGALAAKNWEHPIFGAQGPLWNRDLVLGAWEGDCSLVADVLAALSESEGTPVTRVVVGHTIQPKQAVGYLCGGRLVAVDVGMSNATGIGRRRRAVSVLHPAGTMTSAHEGIAGEVPMTAPDRMGRKMASVVALGGTLLSPFLLVALLALVHACRRGAVGRREADCVVTVLRSDAMHGASKRGNSVKRNSRTLSPRHVVGPANLV